MHILERSSAIQYVLRKKQPRHLTTNSVDVGSKLVEKNYRKSASLAYLEPCKAEKSLRC